METRTYTVYKFDELSEKAKAKALQNLVDINVDFDWWDSTYDDAKKVGLDIKSFDLYRNKHVDGSLTMSMGDSIKAILENHGEMCDTYAFAKEYALITDGASEKEKEGEMYEGVAKKYEQGLCEEYANMLQKEYEYLTSEEAIIETIKANDYDFTEDGTLD